MSSHGATGGGDAVKVAVRVKPLNDHEIADGVQKCVRLADGQIVVGGQRPFAFDFMYGPDSQSEHVFHELVEPLLDDAFFNGYNATVFAYGQTGAGKTFTMTAITQMAIRRICHFVTETERASIPEGPGDEDDDGSMPQGASSAPPPPPAATIGVSMLELHNDTLTDLLVGPPTPSTPVPPLSIVETEARGVYVKNLQECPVEAEDDIARVIELGSSNRKTAETLMNSTSSRSHMMLTITLRYRGAESRLNLVDLAGSERIKKSIGSLRATGANSLMLEGSNPDPLLNPAAANVASHASERLRECISINSGLLALGNVIEALCKRRQHIPFRQSKLTRILQDSLSGNCRTAMIACVSASDHNTEESVSTLNYANRAKSLTTRAVQNITIGIEEAQLEVAALRRERDHYKGLVGQYHRVYGDLGGNSASSAPTASSSSSAAAAAGGGGGAQHHHADLSTSVSAKIHADRDAMMHMQHELSDLRGRLDEALADLDKERRVTNVLEEDLFKAEYDVMTAKDAMRQMRRELAEARGEEAPESPEARGRPSLRGDEEDDVDVDDDVDDADADDSQMAQLQRERERNLDAMAEALSVERPGRRQHQRRGDGGARQGALPARNEQQNAEFEAHLREHERTVQRLREELVDKQHLIEHLTASCDFAEAQVAEFEERTKQAESEMAQTKMGLNEALKQLEVQGGSREHREKVNQSYHSRLTAQQVAYKELRRKLDDAQTSLRSKRADRDRVQRLQQEAQQLSEKLRDREDAHRRLVARSRATHQHEMQQMHRALRDSKSENRRLVATFRKKEDELKMQIAVLQREGPGRGAHHHGGGAGGLAMQTPRNHNAGGARHRDVTAAGDISGVTVAQQQDGGDGGSTTVMGRLMAHTASSRARVKDVNTVSLAPAGEGGQTVASGLSRVQTHVSPAPEGGNSNSTPPRKSRGGSGRSGRQQEAGPSTPPPQALDDFVASPKPPADALAERLGELDRLDRELDEMSDERDRRHSEISEIRQSYDAHRTRRALDAWKYYAQQLQEKIETTADVDELRSLESKLDEVRARIQALEEGHAGALAEKEQELQAVDDHIDSLRVKRTFLLRIIRNLQHQSSASRDRGDDEGDDDDRGYQHHHHHSAHRDGRGRLPPLQITGVSARRKFSSRPTTPRQTPRNSGEYAAA